MIAFGRDCGRFRAALLAFVDRREHGPDTEAALDHLDRCAACTWDLEATTMAITALRRLHVEAQPLEPPADAWLRLRARVDRPREAVWRWRASLAGVVVGAGLVALLLLPASAWTPRAGGYIQEDGPEPGFFAAQRLAEQRAEAAFIESQRATRTSGAVAVVVSPTTTTPSAVQDGWAGPDGLRPADQLLADGPPPEPRTR